MKQANANVRLDVMLGRAPGDKRKQKLEVQQARMAELQDFDSSEGWGTSGDRFGRRVWGLRSDTLCASTMRRTGLEDFGEPSIEPALSILVNSMEREANLHPLGRFLMRVHLCQLLETRLRLAQTWNALSEAMEASPFERAIIRG
jgi:hypothetical protein